MKKSVVTIDGPAGAGKTTVSRMLADRLGYRYIDTGALYRAIALAVHEGGIDSTDDAALEKMCAALSLRYVQTEKGPRLLSNGRDVTDRLRTPEITMLASAVSARPVVRRFLMGVQRAMGREKGAVFEGRDMGTVVFPDADVKFYLDAPEKIRAMRRFLELRPKTELTFEEVERDLLRRDRNDSTRTEAPLKPAVDAIRIDSADLAPAQVVAVMLGHIERLAEN
ncbi:MAG: (d)CMP kinase [Desulfobacterales bacterium]|jgi:cytidylate kinase